MIIVFDLDDTLYDEITYVRSGFKAVAEFLTNKLNIPTNEIYNSFIKILTENGRGRVFDIYLDSINKKNKTLIIKCLSVYRTHKPSIELSTSAIKVRNYLIAKNYTIYIVTDGNKIVQKNKIEALDVKKYVKKTLPTHNYGTDKAKPSIYCFELISKWEKVDFCELVYIGDNPNKDFVNLKKNNAKTIRINQGMFKDVFLDDKYSADFIVNNIEEIIPIIEKYGK